MGGWVQYLDPGSARQNLTVSQSQWLTILMPHLSDAGKYNSGVLELTFISLCVEL